MVSRWTIRQTQFPIIWKQISTRSKKTYSASFETPEDTAIDGPKIAAIDDSATIGRSRADFLDFINESKSTLLSESLLVSYVDLISEGTYIPNLLSSLLLNIPPPLSFV